jgi:hypothetical protein
MSMFRFGSHPDDIEPAPVRTGWRNMVLSVLLTAVSIGALIWSFSDPGDTERQVGRLVAALSAYGLFRWGYHRPRTRRRRR